MDARIRHIRAESVEAPATVPRPDPASDERTMLTGLLDWQREAVHRKASGVSAAHAGVQPFASATSIAGIVKHLALVEATWFPVRFEGEEYGAPWADVDWDADPDWEFRTAATEPLADSLALYDSACSRAREVTARHELDDVGVYARRGPLTLRYVLVHMIEENARHLGHLDILREHLDGVTGE